MRQHSHDSFFPFLRSNGGGGGENGASLVNTGSEGDGWQMQRDPEAGVYTLKRQGCQCGWYELRKGNRICAAVRNLGFYS